MNWFKTLRARFALWTAALFFVALSAFGIYIYGSVANGLYAAIDAQLTLNTLQVRDGLEQLENNQFVLLDTFFQEPENAALRGFTIRVLSPQGQLLQQFGPALTLPPPPTNLTITSSFDTFPDPTRATTVRVCTLALVENNQRVAIVQLAQSLHEAHAELERLLTTLLVSVPLLIAMAGLSGYFLAARALAPIDQITRTAQRISAQDLSARLAAPATDDEVGRLAQTFDAMLARLDNSFQRERQFTADASHELRTPLTAMQAILGMIRAQRRTPEEYEQALTDLAEETDRLRTLTENLLRLARGESRDVAVKETIDLSTLLRDVTDSLRPMAEAKGLYLVCDAPNDLSLLGDSDDLIRLFVNLLDNAVKYTERGGITVSAKRVQEKRLRGDGYGDVHIVTIADTGSGIAAEHLPHLFDRFYRVDESRTLRGAGLGLAIALEIARAHGGQIQVNSTVGKGTEFIVML